MRLITQRAHRYLGETFTLLMSIEVDEGVTVGDVSQAKFAIAHTRGIVEKTDVNLGTHEENPRVLLAATELTEDDLANVRPGTYPFELSLKITGQPLVTLVGIVKFDQSLTLRQEE